MEKKEKKVYEQPRMEAVEVKIEGMICVSTEGGSDIVTPSRDDEQDPLRF